MQSPVKLVPGFFSGVVLPDREVDRPPQSSAEDKNEWSYSSAPPIYFHDMDRGIFTVRTSPRNFMVAAAATDDDDDNPGDGDNGRGGCDDKFQTA
jgi:hypothetical protein